MLAALHTASSTGKPGVTPLSTPGSRVVALAALRTTSSAGKSRSACPSLGSLGESGEVGRS